MASAKDLYKHIRTHTSPTLSSVTQLQMCIYVYVRTSVELDAEYTVVENALCAWKTMTV